MNRYILTSPRFTGEVNVLYGADNKILYIDFMKAELSDEQTKWIKVHLPILYAEEEFKEFATKSKLDVIKEGFKVSFEMWWTKYNRKINKERCVKIWNKLSDADHVNAYFKLGMYDRHLTINDWKTKADPETYLKKRYWDNEWKS